MSNSMPYFGERSDMSVSPRSRRSASSRKKCSNPAGEMISRIRQGVSPALHHVAPLVDAVMPVQRGAQRAGRDRVLHQREAAARLLAPDHEAGTAGAQLGIEAVGGADLARALGCVEAARGVGSLAHGVSFH